MKSEFKATGIFRFYPLMFPKEAFAPNSPTELSLPESTALKNVPMTSLRQYISTTKFWLAKYCMFRYDVEDGKPRKVIMFCQPKRVLLINMNMLYS